MALHFDDSSFLDIAEAQPSADDRQIAGTPFRGTRFRTEGSRFREEPVIAESAAPAEEVTPGGSRFKAEPRKATHRFREEPEPVGPAHFREEPVVVAARPPKPAAPKAPTAPKAQPVPKPVEKVARPVEFGIGLVSVPKLNADDERWLARMLDAFDALELDVALRGDDPVEPCVDEDIDESTLAELEQADADPYANPELHEWTLQPVLERLHPGRRRRGPRRVQLVQSGMNVFIALALTYLTVQGDPATQVEVDGEFASGAERSTEVAASRSDASFVATPTPVQLVATQAPVAQTTPPPVTEPPKPSKPMINPLPGAKLTSGFGNRNSPTRGASSNHMGIDLAKPIGTPIAAAAAGKVVKAGTESGYGRYTCIEHGDGLTTCYGHQAKIEVKVGQMVTQGQRIGTVGMSGVSTGAHLHFEVKKNGAFVNPIGYY